MIWRWGGGGGVKLACLYWIMDTCCFLRGYEASKSNVSTYS